MIEYLKKLILHCLISMTMGLVIGGFALSRTNNLRFSMIAMVIVYLACWTKKD